MAVKKAQYAIRAPMATSEQPEAEAWLAQKYQIWLQKFYLLLKKAAEETDELRKLRSCSIVRLESGQHVVGSKAFFPSEDQRKIKKNNDLFPRVKIELLKGGRKQKVREFLEAIGVKEVSKKEELEIILEKYYSNDVEE